MSSLYFTTSFGSGKSIVKNIVTKFPGTTIDLGEGLQDTSFSTLVFGDAINPKDAKSKLFLCRDLISNIYGSYIGKYRGNVSSRHIDVACGVVDSWFGGLDKKEVVIIDNTSFDCSDTEIDNVIANLYLIISSEI